MTTTLHLPGDQPEPAPADGPPRVPLTRLARGGGSPALLRVVASRAPRPGRVAVAAFQSSV